MPTTITEVSSPRNLEVFLGNPQRKMMIFTGIAVAHLFSDDDDDDNPVQHETAVIKLGQIVTQAPKDGEWTAAVGLTNITNTESDFIFALDAIPSLKMGHGGELELWVNIGVQGDDSTLVSFSYQVTALLEAREAGLQSIQVSDPRAGIGGQWGAETTIQARATWRLRVALDAPAPAPGIPISISSSDPAHVPVPLATVFIQPGHAMSDEFVSPPTGEVIGLTTATISAAYHGQTRAALIHVQPSPK